MATNRFVSIAGPVGGNGLSWATAPPAVQGGALTGLSTILGAASAGDTIFIEAGVHPTVTTGTLNWNKRVNLQGQTQGGANARAIITSNRDDPWPTNGVWTDGKIGKVDGIQYPTLTAANTGSNIITFKETGDGSLFSWLAFRNVGTPFKPSFSSTPKTATITVNDCVSYNTNGMVYIDNSTDGACSIIANRCRSIAYSEGMFRAYASLTAIDCHGDAKSQFHSPSTNLFGAHIQDNSRPFGTAASPGITFTASSDQVTFNASHHLGTNDPVIFAPITGGGTLNSFTVYFVKTVVSATVITLSSTAGGALLDITADGTAWGLILTLAPYNAQFVRCSFINHAAVAPVPSSQSPVNTGTYPQGDGIVGEENTVFLPSSDIVATGNYDRGIDLKCPVDYGNLTRVYSVGNGFGIAEHNDLIVCYITYSFLGTTVRASGDTGKSSPLQASGKLNAVRCVIDQRTTVAGASSQFYAAYGTVQPQGAQAGVVTLQRMGQITVTDSLINLKSGLTKFFSSAGGTPPVTPTYTETNVTTVTV